MSRKPGFSTELKVLHLEGPWWRLTSPLVYWSAILGKIHVPAGFVTDFASVPRLPIAYWFFGSRADEPAVVHDYLYRDLGKMTSRYLSDQVFLEAMEAEGYAWYSRWPIYAGVRVGGRWAYKAHDSMDPREG